MALLTGNSGSLLGLLILIIAVALLFTGRYLPGLFDLVMGMERWTYRVITYTLLLRDEYPPFRLDQGPTDPAPTTPTAPTTLPGTEAPRYPQLDLPDR